MSQTEPKTEKPILAKKEASQRHFYLIVAGASLLVAAVKHFRGHGQPALIWAGVAIALLILEFGLPPVATELFAIWMKFAKVLGTINTAILVTLIYFIVLTPVGVIRRFAKRKGANLDHNNANSNFFSLEAIPETPAGRESYFHPY